MEEKQKKPWYKSTPGLVLIVLFWYVLVPVVIYQSKMEKKKKIMYGSIYIFAMILFYGSIFLSENKSSVSKREETKNNEIAKSEELQKLSQEKAKLEEEKRNLEIRKNVETEKNIITNKILKIWEKVERVEKNYSENTGSSQDPYNYYYKGKESVVAMQEIIIEAQNLNCNITGDKNFDNKCENVLKSQIRVLIAKKKHFENIVSKFDRILTEGAFLDRDEIDKMKASTQKTLTEVNELFLNFGFEFENLKKYEEEKL